MCLWTFPYQWMWSPNNPATRSPLNPFSSSSSNSHSFQVEEVGFVNKLWVNKVYGVQDQAQESPIATWFRSDARRGRRRQWSGVKVLKNALSLNIYRWARFEKLENLRIRELHLDRVNGWNQVKFGSGFNWAGSMASIPVQLGFFILRTGSGRFWITWTRFFTSLAWFLISQSHSNFNFDVLANIHLIPDQCH